MSYLPGAEPNIAGLAGAGAGPGGHGGAAWATPAVGVDTSAFRAAKKDIEGFSGALGKLFRQIEGFVGGKGRQFEQLITTYGKVARGGGGGGGAFRSAFGHGSASMPSVPGPWGQMQSSNEQAMAKVGQGQMFDTGRLAPGYQAPPFGTTFQQGGLFGGPGRTTYAAPGGAGPVPYTPQAAAQVAGGLLGAPEQSSYQRMQAMGSGARAAMTQSVQMMRAQLSRAAGPARALGEAGTAVGLDVAAGAVYGSGMTYNAAAWALADTMLDPRRQQRGIQRDLSGLRGAQSPGDAAQAAMILQSTLGRPYGESPRRTLRMADQLSQMTRYRMSETASAQAYGQEYANRWNIFQWTGLRFGADNPPNVNELAKVMAQRYGGLQEGMDPRERQRRIASITAPNSYFRSQMERIIPGSPQLQQGVTEALQRYGELGGQFYTGTAAQRRKLGIGTSPQEVQQDFTVQLNKAKESLSRGLLPAFTQFLKILTGVMKPFQWMNDHLPHFAETMGVVLAGFAGLSTILAGRKLLTAFTDLFQSIATHRAVTTADTVATELDTRAKLADAGASGAGGAGLIGRMGGLATGGAALGGLGAAGLVAGSGVGGIAGGALGSKAVGGHGTAHFAAKTGGGIAGGAAVGAGLGLLGGPFAPITVPGGAAVGAVIGGIGSLFVGDPPAGRGHYVPSTYGKNPVSQQKVGQGDGPIPGPGHTQGMQSTLLDKLVQLFRANPRLILNSGYRSTQQQAALYAAYKAHGGAVVAPPGRSMHEKGLAADIGPPSEYGWLNATAPKFGLVRTVPSEPWHFEPAGARSGLGTAQGPVPDTTDEKGGAAEPITLDPFGYSKSDLHGQMSMLAGVVASMRSNRGSGSAPTAPGGGPNVDVGGGMGLVNVLKLAQGHGLHGKALQTAVAIAGRESNWQPGQHNYNLSTGDDSWGLWQINMLGAMGPERRKMFGIQNNSQLLDPNTNARAMMILSGGGTNWTPWSTYKNSSFAGLMDQVGKAMTQYNIGDPPMAGPGTAAHAPAAAGSSANAPVVIRAGGFSGASSLHLHIGTVNIPLQFTQALTPQYLELIVARVKAIFVSDELLEMAGG